MKIETPQEIVAEHPNASLYVSLAKGALWATSFVLVVIVGAGVMLAFSEREFVAFGGVVVQACQTLSIIAITVLGYHGYKGQHLFHNLRHWNDGPETKGEA